MALHHPAMPSCPAYAKSARTMFSIHVCRGGSGRHAGGRRAVSGPAARSCAQPEICDVQCGRTPARDGRWPGLPPPAWPCAGGSGCVRVARGAQLGILQAPQTGQPSVFPPSPGRRIEVLGEIPELSYPRDRSQRFNGSK